MSKPKPNPFRDMPFPGTGLPGGYRADGKHLAPEAAAPAIAEQPQRAPATPEEPDTDDTPPNSSAARRKAALRNKE